MTDGPPPTDERPCGLRPTAATMPTMQPQTGGTDLPDAPDRARPATLGGGRSADRTLVLATDLAAASEDALAWALDLAVRLGARLLLVHVLDPRRLHVGHSHPRVDQARAERESLLLDLVRRAARAGVHAEFLVWQGDVGASIVAAAEAEAAEIVVVGARDRRSPERLALGSVSEHVVRHSPCPVLVVRRAVTR